MISRLAFAAIAALALAGAALAHDYTAGPLKIEHPWTRATPAGAKVAGGYLAIQNSGSAADKLTGGSSEIAGRIEVHEMSMKDGVMTMRPLETGLEIKPGAKVELKPGGFHIMFLDLRRQLKQGEKVKSKLTFEKAGTVEVEFVVDAVGARSSGEAGAAAHGTH